MNLIRRKEFLAILADVVSIPRPMLDYSALSNATFAALEFHRRLMEIQACFMLTLRATGRYPTTARGLGLIVKHSAIITPEGLAEDYEVCSEVAVVGLIAHLKVEEFFVAAELERRILDKRIGNVLVLAPFFCGPEAPEPSAGWYEAHFQMKLGPKEPGERDVLKKADDLPEASYLRALELSRELIAPTYEPGPLPDFPLEMKPLEAAFWNKYLGKVWRRGHETLRKGLIPVLNGDAERIPKSAANHRDTERKKDRDRWRMLHDGIKRSSSDSDLLDESELTQEESETSDVESPDYEPHENEAIYERIHAPQGIQAIHPDTQAIYDELTHQIPTPEESTMAREAYDFALSRFGDRGGEFMKALLANGGNVTAASEAVGISRVTGSTWRTEIRTHFSEKKPTK